MKPVITAEKISKQYRLGAINHGTLYRDLQSYWARFRGADDPNSKVFSNAISDPNDPVQKFWALDDVSFQIYEGDLVGIVGKNGAGKSTLLKILSRVTAPTSGSIRYRGRIASLLEVGTGFHPELSGRENIFLNGSILGMRKPEIRRKFDEIISFAEIERFVDTPVKRYSSGMYVRLAFAVAAHLDPEILIVDEVLAVGDAEFQKKCIGKMGEVGKQGRTILFVSHNMEAIKRLCSRGIYLEKGKLDFAGSIQETVLRYNNPGISQQDFSNMNLSNRLNRHDCNILITKVVFVNSAGEECYGFVKGEQMKIQISFIVRAGTKSLGVYVAFNSEITGDMLTNIKLPVTDRNFREGEQSSVEIDIPHLPFRTGSYRFCVYLGSETFSKFYDVVDENVGLPSLSVFAQDDDVHTNMGYFDIIAAAKEIKQEN